MDLNGDYIGLPVAVVRCLNRSSVEERESVSVIDNLLAVQERDVRIRQIRKELKDIPERQTAEQTRLEQHEQALGQAEDSLKKLQSDVKQLEIECAGHRERINKLRQQQMTLKTNKEFKVMEGEIAGVEGEISGLEDREIVLMEAVEAAKSDVEARRRDLAEEQTAVETDVKQLDERAVGLKAELVDEEAARAVAARDVLPDWLERYDMVISRRDLALVPVENGVCGGCHMKLPPSTVHDSRKRTLMVTCDYCGRLLYS
jgi:uncharacterized protein